MLIPHSDEVQLEDAVVSKDFMAVFTRRAGLQVTTEPAGKFGDSHSSVCRAYMTFVQTWSITLAVLPQRPDTLHAHLSQRAMLPVSSGPMAG